ncbi:hypothetical protein C943_04598 [Mariniradius saccharolyticus AK6]|uniref:Uncharacterized protein n=1 Tax=Mariniradius saccharolyticus AK6 TaxID=1239962 RepID=M7XFS9_9BACT|nr:hypothetical protein C943_04598 [Mariniradius saccharolyticus AK6]
MDDALVGCLLLFLVSLVWFIGYHTRTKRGHYRRMQQLKGLFYALLSKQEALNQKTAISNEFHSTQSGVPSSHLL